MKRKIGAIVLILIAVSIFCYAQNNWIGKSGYQLQFSSLPENFTGFKIIQISDLHSKAFGKDQQGIVQIIKNANPDIIAITGDLIDSRHFDAEASMSLVRQAVKIAPVYFVSGNHEERSGKYPLLKKALEDAGVIVLENDSSEIAVGGQSIFIAGIDDSAQGRETYGEADSLGLTLKKMKAAGEPGAFRLLLVHRPEMLARYARYGFDLILSGHAHGGQIRLPFLGGLVAPGQGFFPRYSSGVYRENRSVMVVSRGLGNSLFPQRIFNRPEIVEVTLIGD